MREVLTHNLESWSFCCYFYPRSWYLLIVFPLTGSIPEHDSTRRVFNRISPRQKDLFSGKRRTLLRLLHARKPHRREGPKTKPSKKTTETPSQNELETSFFGGAAKQKRQARAAKWFGPHLPLRRGPLDHQHGTIRPIHLSMCPGHRCIGEGVSVAESVQGAWGVCFFGMGWGLGGNSDLSAVGGQIQKVHRPRCACVQEMFLNNMGNHSKHYFRRATSLAIRSDRTPARCHRIPSFSSSFSSSSPSKRRDVTS